MKQCIQNDVQIFQMEHKLSILCYHLTDKDGYIERNVSLGTYPLQQTPVRKSLQEPYNPRS